jgi:hypothetical protein
MEGDMDELVNALRIEEKAERLVEFEAEEKAGNEKDKSRA